MEVGAVAEGDASAAVHQAEEGCGHAALDAVVGEVETLLGCEHNEGGVGGIVQLIEFGEVAVHRGEDAGVLQGLVEEFGPQRIGPQGGVDRVDLAAAEAQTEEAHQSQDEQGGRQHEHEGGADGMFGARSLRH